MNARRRSRSSCLSRVVQISSEAPTAVKVAKITNTGCCVAAIRADDTSRRPKVHTRRIAHFEALLRLNSTVTALLS